jgi:mannose-6-phosphate isomerase-like protein (cupin superfamily)
VSAIEPIKRLPGEPDVIAPDGSEVRVLLGLPDGSLAHFQLEEGATTLAVRHRSVGEVWYVLNGTGEVWRRFEGEESTDALARGVCLTIPVGTSFQFRSFGPGPLEILGVTMPPWPGPGEAVVVEGAWSPTVEPGPP